MLGQQESKIKLNWLPELKSFEVSQQINFTNETKDTLKSIVLNDWNHAYSSKTTPLAKRFSDEFYRGFHLAKEEERGSTQNLNITNAQQTALIWQRPENHPDLIEVTLLQPLLPGEKTTLLLRYNSKIPHDKFTKIGYNDTGGVYLKNTFLYVARYENHDFVRYSNYNLDDTANAITDLEVVIATPNNWIITTDLNANKAAQDQNSIYQGTGKNRTDFTLSLQHKANFYSYNNALVNVWTDLKQNKVDDMQKAISVDRIVQFTHSFLGNYPQQNIMVAQADYDKNPFYGLNQLPSFLSPFPNEFLFEIKFLKTYLNSFLKNSLHLDPRKDNWLYDGLQVYLMMQYIENYYPDSKLIGSLAKLKLLKPFSLADVKFNEQYSYFYMLMARKNLDQALGEPKSSLIKFNEQIANKYKAGLSLSYLDSYLQNNVLRNTILEFYQNNQTKNSTRTDFETILKSKTASNLDWFFNTIINYRSIVDYKFKNVSSTKDNITFSVKNKTGTQVPVPIFGLAKGKIVYQKWFDIKACDTTMTIPRQAIDKMVINLKNEVPEYNLRNNWFKLNGFFPNNRPLKFAFFKDLEDPYFNQILFLPSIYYNFYDGLTPGLRLHNKTILDKPFTFDVNPSYSTKSQNLSGAAAFVVNQNIRNSNLFNIKYGLSANYFNYAADASYLRLNTSVQMRIREPNFRDNRKQFILLRQINVDRESSNFVNDNSPNNYSVLDLRYNNNKTEVTNHINFTAVTQFSGKFGKATAEVEFRKLYENNRQLNLRLYVGSFLYNKTDSDYFSFALDRPTDYLFDYNYLGRSESSGLFSQQYIIAEGGFKSKLSTPFANTFLSSLNASVSIWNWIEVYGDVGILKNRSQKERFVFDSGVRLNLVTDYFELYFPVYSSNGWEISSNNYNEKVRFIVTFSPKTLINLFSRKWF